MAKILVVDDDKTMRSSIGKFVAYGGHIVVEAESGLDAMQKFESSANDGDWFDIVLSDIEMPDGTGIELHVELEHRLGDCEFVLMSGAASDPHYVGYAGERGVKLLPKGGHELREFIRELQYPSQRCVSEVPRAMATSF